MAKQLATIMQILLVKRLESSFTAFTQSLLNLRRYTENMIKMWENDTIFVCPQIDVNKELDYEAKTEKRGKRVSFNDCVEDIRAKIKKLTEQGRNEKGQNAEYKRKDFKEEYYIQLKEDFDGQRTHKTRSLMPSKKTSSRNCLTRQRILLGSWSSSQKLLIQFNRLQEQ